MQVLSRILVRLIGRNGHDGIRVAWLSLKIRLRFILAKSIAGIASGSPSSIESLCLFVGYPRSGHSLVGQLLNAHPNALIAHELDLLGFVELGSLSRDEVYWLLRQQKRWFARRRYQWGSYDYQLGNLPREGPLLVIGDKKGGRTALRLARQPELLTRLSRKTGLPVKLVHVVRHPLDNIASRHDRAGGSLLATIGEHFDRASVISHLIKEGNFSILTIHLEDLIANPTAVLNKLREFLDLPESMQWIRACEAKLLDSPPRSRDLIENWDPLILDLIWNMADRCSFYDGYRNEVASEGDEGVS